MKSYPSIESVWVREGKHLVHGALRQPEHALVRDWLITEKIDGTNIRLIFTEDGLDVRGRTDKAQFAPHHLDFLKGLVDVPAALDYLRHPTKPDWNVTVYGELFGPGIQRGGKCSDDLQFRAFDVLYGDHVWASFDEMSKVVRSLGLEPVPVVATAPTVTGLPETAAEMDALLGTSRVCPRGGRMEGFVARPPLTLLNGKGERIIYKLTYRDVPEVREAA